jgi:hypothetical protein
MFPAEESIYQAALLRFRPIMMTTFAALLGAVPLALGHGTGAEIGQPLGYAIVGGLLVSSRSTRRPSSIWRLIGCAVGAPACGLAKLSRRKRVCWRPSNRTRRR